MNIRIELKMLGSTHIPKIDSSINPIYSLKKIGLIEYEGTRENIPQMFCTYIRIEWKISGFRKTVFHTFPKSVYPTPLLTLEQRLNGAQTRAVFLYFSILNSLPTKKTSLFLSLHSCKVSQIMMPFFYIYILYYIVASCLFCK